MRSEIIEKFEVHKLTQVGFGVWFLISMLFYVFRGLEQVRIMIMDLLVWLVGISGGSGVFRTTRSYAWNSDVTSSGFLLREHGGGVAFVEKELGAGPFVLRVRVHGTVFEKV